MHTVRPILSNLEILDHCDRLLEEIEDLLLGVEPMSTEEIRRMATVPSDADDFVVEVIRLCKALDLERLCEGTTLANATEDMALASASPFCRFQAAFSKIQLPGGRCRAGAHSRCRPHVGFYRNRECLVLPGDPVRGPDAGVGTRRGHPP